MVVLLSGLFWGLLRLVRLNKNFEDLTIEDLATIQGVKPFDTTKTYCLEIPTGFIEDFCESVEKIRKDGTLKKDIL